MTAARFALRPAVELAELEALARTQDKALGYPRPGWGRDGKRLPPGVGETLHYALPVPDEKRTRYALRLLDLDPDALPEPVTAKLAPVECTELVAALRAREELPIDWTGPKSEPITPTPELEPVR